MLIQGESIPYGQLKGKIIDQMIDEGILLVQLQGRSRKTIFAIKPEAVTNFLSSHLGINNLKTYINNEESGLTRAENIIASSDITASDYSLEFKNVPSNGVYWLKCTTEGKEERAFAYGANGQVWW